jgi:hypothetical protein
VSQSCQLRLERTDEVVRGVWSGRIQAAVSARQQGSSAAARRRGRELRGGALRRGWMGAAVGRACCGCSSRRKCEKWCG